MGQLLFWVLGIPQHLGGDRGSRPNPLLSRTIHYSGEMVNNMEKTQSIQLSMGDEYSHHSIVILLFIGTC